ncbi:flagellar biosynthesis protein FlgA [Micromonospora purpureochromogenes]|uniref:flagellar biosynthesis protein FlgA n=1 Tax=Micromonospora purpureochromogenes TaxID=47872 RepID=UPI0033DAA418
MAGGGPDGRDSLRPVRRLRRPGGGTLLRLGLVAALLGLAVVVLDSAGGCPTPAPPSPGSSADRATAEGTPAGSRGGTGSAGDLSGGESSGAPGAGPSTGGGRRGALPLPSGSVGVPVRLAEPAALAVLRPGARVDLLVVPAGRTPVEAALVASGALVLDVVGGDAADGSSALYLALRPDQAQRAVGQPEGSRFAVVVRG